MAHQVPLPYQPEKETCNRLCQMEAHSSGSTYSHITVIAERCTIDETFQHRVGNITNLPRLSVAEQRLPIENMALSRLGPDFGCPRTFAIESTCDILASFGTAIACLSGQLKPQRLVLGTGGVFSGVNTKLDDCIAEWACREHVADIAPSPAKLMIAVGDQVPLDALRHDRPFLQLFSEFPDTCAESRIESMFGFKRNGGLRGDRLCVKFDNVVDVAGGRIHRCETPFTSFVESYPGVRVLAVASACG